MPEPRITTIMRDRIARICLLLIVGLSLASPASAQNRPTDIVGRLNDTLLSVMHEADALGSAGRYERLDPVLRDIFAFSTMARVAAGGHWQTLTSGQRRHLIDAFTRFSIATYANRFNGFSGERFEIKSEEEAARGSMIVHSTIVTGANETIPLDYLLRQSDDAWKIVDVYLEGSISELATRRSEYNAILADQGFDGLITRLEDRIVALQAAPD